MQSFVFFVIHLLSKTVKTVHDKWLSCIYNHHLNFPTVLCQFIDFYLILIRKEPANYTSKASKSYSQSQLYWSSEYTEYKVTLNHKQKNKSWKPNSTYKSWSHIISHLSPALQDLWSEIVGEGRGRRGWVLLRVKPLNIIFICIANKSIFVALRLVCKRQHQWAI